MTSRHDEVAPPLAGCALSVVEFDFDCKEDREIAPAAIHDALAAGRYLWIDVDVTDPTAARELLTEFKLANLPILEQALTQEPATQVARYDESLHVAMTGCALQDGKLALQRLDCVLAEGYLLTIHKGKVGFLDAVRRSYHTDFQRFARSPSFLVYELWDHLIETYLEVQKTFEERVERAQAQLIGEVDDSVFQRLSSLGGDLLHLRKVMLPARAVLAELSTRKSVFISEATQPFLANMVGTLERVLQDLLVDRDILSESLNLYMSMVGHRTNRVMTRLTIVSIVFLPLTFLCGVYGMNFHVLPEKDWEYGYLFFWVLVVVIAGAIVYVMKRKKLL